VAKANTWYLVCRLDGHLRADSVSRIIEARVTGETFERPADFDLAAYWSQWCSEHEANRPRYVVTVRVSSELMPWLLLYFDGQAKDTIEVAGPAGADGRLTLRLTFETFEDARTRILGLGRAAEVLEPRALRESVVDFARQIVAFYGE
jgi:predicted DNA-binding transcriptional regulator YafY